MHRLFAEAGTSLDVTALPELYVQNNRTINGMCIGLSKPFIVVNSGSLELLDDEELRCLLGHELGHIMSGHVLYRTMIVLLMQLATLGFPVIGLAARVVLVDQKPGVAVDHNVWDAGVARREDRHPDGGGLEDADRRALGVLEAAERQLVQRPERDRLVVPRVRLRCRAAELRVGEPGDEPLAQPPSRLGQSHGLNTTFTGTCADAPNAAAIYLECSATFSSVLGPYKC